MARDNRIYGLDETSAASKIASDALNPKGASENFWSGSAFDQSARGKGNVPQFENPDAKAVTSTGKQSVKKSEGNH